MKMLITGTSGFLGRRAAAYFNEKYTVLAPSHSTLDITNAQSVNEYFKVEKPDCVIHCAAVSGVMDCENNPEATRVINVEGTGNIAHACGANGAKLLFCSSDQVYFGSGFTVHAETDTLSPANVYGRQKLRGEVLCAQLAPGSTSLRLSWMYDTNRITGEHGDFLTGFFAAVNGEAPLTEPVHDMRGITDVNEVLRGMETLLTAKGGVYNFGAENTYNTYDTVYKLLEATGLDTGVLTKNEQAFKDAPRSLAMTTTKARSIGITFTPTLDGLVKAVEKLK